MNPDVFSARLRAFADKLDRSENPSRSLVIAGLRAALEAVSGAPEVAAAPSKVVVCDYWSLDDAKEVAAELGGTDLREGPYGDIGMLLPVDAVAQLKADSGEDVMVFDSWEAASGDDQEYEFTPVAV